MPTYLEWDREVLEQCYQYVDGLSLHRYFGNDERETGNDTSKYLALNLSMERQLVESSTYEVSGLDPVAHLDVAGSLDRNDGKLSLFILNRDLSKAPEVEVVWEDAAPARAISASLLTGDDLKASNSFAAPQRVAPQSFRTPATSGGRSKFEVPARSYTVIQWLL